MKNVKTVKLTLTEIGVKHFNRTPTFSNMLHRDQLSKLVVGENTLRVNHYIFSRLQTAQSWDKENITVEEVKQ